MPETATPPRTIRARVHEDAIGRVTRFFNATTVETLNELFQNARRAGATRIDVRIADGAVTDDGGGITDPAALLAFGQSRWNTKAAQREDPAGMGVYALARRPHVSIRSRPRPTSPDATATPGWQVRLPPAHFLGKEHVILDTTDGDRMPIGTEVTFEDDKAHPADVKTAARYFPLPVACNGEDVERLDFLHDTLHTEERRGIRIGAYAARHSPGRHPQSELPRHPRRERTTAECLLDGLALVRQGRRHRLPHARARPARPQGGGRDSLRKQAAHRLPNRDLPRDAHP